MAVCFQSSSESQLQDFDKRKQLRHEDWTSAQHCFLASLSADITQCTCNSSGTCCIIQSSRFTNSKHINCEDKILHKREKDTFYLPSLSVANKNEIKEYGIFWEWF